LLASRRIAVVLLLLVAPNLVRADEPAGRAVYVKMCLRCHGPAGEGTKEYPHPLVGNRALPQLTKYVAKSMPEDKPGTCVGPDATQVAAYIYDAFYSAAAQAKIKAPRTELARLTVGEYRNVIADLLANSRPVVGKEEGLKAVYQTSDGKGKRKEAIKRVDPSIHFDFNEKAHDFQKLDTDELFANWQGSVTAPESGLYDFILRTEHSTKLWVNDMRKPLIDASIKSGPDTEFKNSIFLLAGRPVPIKVEFHRGSVGVRKDKKEKAPTVKTTMSLEWKPPTRPADVILPKYLKPTDTAPTFAVSVALPADDRSAGYERGNAVSKAWVQGITDGALETANFIVANLAEVTGVRPDAKDRKEKLREWCERFATKAFRRPLTPEQKKLYVDRQFEKTSDPESAVKRVVLLVLESPRFLYREPTIVTNSGDAYDVAARLAFEMWGTMPDEALLKAAATGKLATRDDVRRETWRMMDDPRTRAKMQEFFTQWLRLDQAGDLARDMKKFPGFEPAVVGDLRTSLEMFLDETMWSDGSDFRKLLSADQVYMNGRLAKLYGVDLPAEAPFTKVTLPAGDRAGVLTHPYLMAKFAYTATSSPIHRGVFVARNVLGVALRPPPDAFTPLPPEKVPDLSTRERITLQTRAKNCQGCHGVINPLGFTLENFDAIGRFRTEENGKPVDSRGSFVTRSGDTVEFHGVKELSKFLQSSDEAQEAFVARLFHNTVKQPILAFGPEKLAELRRYFADNQFNMRRLLVEIVVETAVAEKATRTAEAGKR
jgi:mono/diheme cytochrome c family protein